MDEHERKELAIEVRSMRKGQGLKQEDLAAKARVGVRTIRNLEAGKPVSDGTLSDVISALGYKYRKPTWSDDVQVFLDMIGYRLQRLDEEQRAALIADITRTIIRPV